MKLTFLKTLTDMIEDIQIIRKKTNDMVLFQLDDKRLDWSIISDIQNINHRYNLR